MIKGEEGQKDKKYEIDVSKTILYAIDIPLKDLHVDLDRLFKRNFVFSESFLPGTKYCYYQFVSSMNCENF